MLSADGKTRSTNRAACEIAKSFIEYSQYVNKGKNSSDISHLTGIPRKTISYALDIRNVSILEVSKLFLLARLQIFTQVVVLRSFARKTLCVLRPPPVLWLLCAATYYRVFLQFYSNAYNMSLLFDSLSSTLGIARIPLKLLYSAIVRIQILITLS
ncbi:hypothetical protein [Gardnerella swidsinskii]|uniref:Uncharacterized protein n=2 Tax=Gardnerella swidsinskii TaxID=2792979 RepID=A0ABM6GHG4_9BIFI|nr:hypothetical protein BVL65_00380 [Gardnerella vaginalis]